MFCIFGPLGTGIVVFIAMSILDRLRDAQFLYANGRRDGALLSVLVAVAATSRRRYPKPPHSDREAFTQFLAEEMVVVTLGGPKKYNIRVPGADTGKYPDEMMPLGECFYEFVRCNLAHEAMLPNNVEFEPAKLGILTVQITDKVIRLSDTFMDGLGRAVEYAPENIDLFAHIAEMPDDVIAWNLFGKRRIEFSDYMAVRRKRANSTAENGGRK